LPFRYRIPAGPYWATRELLPSLPWRNHHPFPNYSLLLELALAFEQHHHLLVMEIGGGAQTIATVQLPTYSSTISKLLELITCLILSLIIFEIRASMILPQLWTYWRNWHLEKTEHSYFQLPQRFLCCFRPADLDLMPNHFLLPMSPR